MPRQPKVARGRQPRGSTSDHPDRWFSRSRHRPVRLVPHRARGEALHAVLLRDESLERADCNRRVDGAPPACRLARRRAHPSADGCERVGPTGDQVRVAVSPFRNRGDIAAGIGVHWACRAARLVGPQPARVRIHGRRHQITCRCCRRRSSQAMPKSPAKNTTVVIPTRWLRSSPLSCVSSAFTPKTRTATPARTIATADNTARGQPTVGDSVHRHRALSQLSPASEPHDDGVAHVTVNGACIPIW